METRVDGGYVAITVGQFANVCEARKSGRISFLALRVWLAAHEQRARRCVAKGPVSYAVSELAALIGGELTERAIRRALRELRVAELIDWSRGAIAFPVEVHPEAAAMADSFGTHSRRPVPVPRFVLRALIRHRAPSEVMAAIGHLIRCLFRNRREISNAGLVKASWVASVFGIAERSVHSARRWLMRLGFLTQEVVHQLVMNRWGGKFAVSLKQVRGGESAPRASDFSTDFAPLPKPRTPNGSRNHEPRGAERAGVCTANTEIASRKPTLKDVTAEDLRKLDRLEVLYHEALRAKWLEPSESAVRNFVCAALRATRAGGRVGAIFVGIVRRKLWHHVTQEQEDRAMKVLKSYRDRNPNAFGFSHGTSAECSTPDKRVFELVENVLKCAERPRLVVNSSTYSASDALIPICRIG